MSLGKIRNIKKSGIEKFIHKNSQLELDISAFWQWSSSDILSNALRGVLAEFIVKSDIGITCEVREEWDAYDLVTPEDIKVEVKSSSYLQSWSQNKLSAISFGIQRTQGWDASTNITSDEIQRQADVYVFCVLSHKDKATVNPLNLDQWDFYILATSKLNKKCPTQKTITLSSLLNLSPIVCEYGNIGESIKNAIS